MLGFDARLLVLVVIIVLLLLAGTRLQKYNKNSRTPAGELQKGFDNLKSEKPNSKNKD